MKVKRVQIWKKTGFGNRRRFRFWSNRVGAEKDDNLPPDASLPTWIKVAILVPKGRAETVFHMGFADTFGNVKVSSAKRRIGDGPFAMRMGPEDCEFFIASKKAEVRLELKGYSRIVSRRKEEEKIIVY